MAKLDFTGCVASVRLHRSELCVPGANMRMMEKAPGLGADVVMLDLEDAVAPDDKPQARENVDRRAARAGLERLLGVAAHQRARHALLLPRHRRRGRAEPAAGSTPCWCRRRAAPATSTSSRRCSTQIEDAVGLERRIGISALIETAPGMLNVEEIAAACPERMEALIFGVADYAASMQSHTASIGGSDAGYAVLTDPNGDGAPRAALGRPVALPAGAHRGRLPRQRPAPDRRPVRRLQRRRGLHRRGAARRGARLRGQVGDPPEPDPARQRGLLARRAPGHPHAADHRRDEGGRRGRARARSRSTGG